MLTVDIEKRLGCFHLQVNFSTHGELLALLGASGSGKSLTLKCIAGIETPDRGRIVLNDRVLFDSERKINLPPQKRHVGYLFQQYALFPNMTVAQNIGTGLRAVPKQERPARIQALVRTFRLEGLEQHRPSQLSGGQQQRVALARCLASAPEVLLLDEPFAALDEYLRWQLELELMDTLERYSGDAILVTHSRDEAIRLSQRVCLLHGGRSAPVEPVGTLMSAPGTVPAALLSGCKNLSPLGVRAGNRGTCTAWGVTLTFAGPIPDAATAVGLRAHALTPWDGEGENVISCTVDRIIDNVFSTVVMLRPTGGTGLLRMELDKKDFTACVGDRITVRAPREALMPLTGDLDP